jgi:hypothetical protein
MAQIIELKNERLEVAHILNEYVGHYEKTYPLWPEQRKIVSDLIHCRTAYLGGHLERCTHCGVERIQYHSCRNRHCPKCQHMPRERWLAQRKEEILPTTYFHVVFTLPHELNPIILNNKTIMLNILFKAVSQTLLDFGKNKLSAKLGFMAILHTWDQRLNAHFHLHCLVAGGAVSSDWTRWIPCHSYLFNEQALSVVFRGKFMEQMTRTIITRKLPFAGSYQQLKDKLYDKHWVVSVREPIKRPEHVLEYLARYTHRVAIANSRLIELKDGNLTFRFKDRKTNQVKYKTIKAVDFIRRFLLHSLPRGFVRIRHYGFLANRNRKNNLAKIARLFRVSLQTKQRASLKHMMLQLTGVDITLCPCCQKGKMRVITQLPPQYRSRHSTNLIRPPNHHLTATG